MHLFEISKPRAWYFIVHFELVNFYQYQNLIFTEAWYFLAMQTFSFKKFKFY